jgi:hypothetical protein
LRAATAYWDKCQGIKRITLHKYEGESNENFKNAEAEYEIRENICVKVNDEATMLDVSHGSAEHIIHSVGR